MPFLVICMAPPDGLDPSGSRFSAVIHLYPGQAASHVGKLAALIRESPQPVVDASGTRRL
jgi:hypothetical protein